jgi:hypothetical protein
MKLKSTKPMTTPRTNPEAPTINMVMLSIMRSVG